MLAKASKLTRASNKRIPPKNAMTNSHASALEDGSPAAASRLGSNFTLVAAIALGNGLEMFDFTIFSFFQVVIGRQFFPSTTPFVSLLMATAMFGAGFVVRPVGGVALGAYADRAGRKRAMLLTIALMATGTAIIGLTPTYAQIGALAPFLIMTGRLLQGFSAGGEVGASTALLADAAPRKDRGFMISWQMASQGGAALSGAMTAFLLSAVLSPIEIEDWGWRIPFLFGLLLGPLGYAIRATLHESPLANRSARGATLPTLKAFRRSLAAGSLLMVGGTASMYIVVFYMPTYLTVALHMPASTSFLASCVSGMILMVGSPLAGKLSDRLAKRKPFVACSRLLGAVLIYPAFLLVNHTANPCAAIAAISVLACCLTLGSGATFQLLLESFPKAIWSTGFSTIYSIGVSLFGGFAPFVVTWLIKRTGDPLSPAHYMVACSLVSMIALIAIRERGAE